MGVFEQCHSAEKYKRGDPLVQSKIFRKSHSAEENRGEKHQDSQRGILSMF